MAEISPSGRSGTPWRWRVALLCVLIVVAAAAVTALVWRSAIAPIPAVARDDVRPELVRRGAVLAAAGACAECHTTSGGRSFAGGRALETPFGTLYGSNITPDRDTGIGDWSPAAFSRALREGVDRAGRHLYPAFPYNHYTRLSDGDIAALYAFLMTRDPVRQESRPPELRFPYSVRPFLAGWKLLFLRQGPLAPDPGRGPEWNRGAYLADALGHCGACHSPRNALGAESGNRTFAGGEAEGWWAPPLDRSSPAPIAWSVDSLSSYLTSWDATHGGAVGPMRPVVEGLSRLSREDVRALAAFVASTLGPDRAEGRTRVDAIIARGEPGGADPAVARGGAVYRGACAGCHESGGAVPFTVASLAQHTTLAGPDPRNVIRVILEGVPPREGEAGAIMPGFAGTLTQDQTGDLLAYLRARFTDGRSWPHAAQEVRRISAERPAREEANGDEAQR